MKIKSFAIASLFAAGAICSAQNTINFQPHYHAGDVDHYKMNMSMTGQMAMNMSMSMTQKCTKVYPNGDADLTVTIGDMLMNGKPSPMGKNAPSQSMRVNKYGVPVNGQANGMMGNMGFNPGSMGSMMPHRPMHAGESIPINEPGKNGMGGMKGKLKIASIAGGIAHLVLNGDISMGTMGAMHMDMNMAMSCADSKLRSMTGVMTTNMGGKNSVTHMTMTRT